MKVIYIALLDLSKQEFFGVKNKIKDQILAFKNLDSATRFVMKSYDMLKVA